VLKQNIAAISGEAPPFYMKSLKAKRPPTRGSHSSTFRLNVNTFGRMRWVEPVNKIGSG